MTRTHATFVSKEGNKNGEEEEEEKREGEAEEKGINSRKKKNVVQFVGLPDFDSDAPRLSNFSVARIVWHNDIFLVGGT